MKVRRPKKVTPVSSGQWLPDDAFQRRWPQNTSMVVERLSHEFSRRFLRSTGRSLARSRTAGSLSARFKEKINFYIRKLVSAKREITRILRRLIALQRLDLYKSLHKSRPWNIISTRDITRIIIIDF